MSVAFFPVVRSAIAGFGFAFLAAACSAQSGDPSGTSSQALHVDHYYTCASTGACDEDAGACTTVSGCTLLPTADAGVFICTQTTPCATGDLDTAQECTVNPVCQATEHIVSGGGGGGGGCTTWCGTKCC
jgi:hypothetical protein